MTIRPQAAVLLDRLFGIDLRALAALRISVGILMLCDLAGRAGDLVAHYTDGGVLPRALLAQGAWTGHADYDFRWSIHMANGRAEFQALLFALAATGLLAMIVGYRTRAATVFSWAMLVSLHTRNHVVLDGGDIALRCVMFWAMFLPLGARASVDAWRRAPPPDRCGRVTTVATAVFLLQVAAVYFFSAGHKDHPRWTEQFSAVYYALSLDVFATSTGKWLLNFPFLLQILTAGTMFLEWVGPVAAFLPVAAPWLRVFVVASFWSFHAGLILGMELGIFPLIMMAAWIPFLPSPAWDALERRLAPLGKRLGGCDFGRMGRVLFPRPERVRVTLHPVSAVLVSGLAIYVLIWNLREWSEDRWRWLPGGWNAVGRATGLDQRWDMFAPYPTVDDGWYVMRGELRDRTEVDLWRMTAGLSHEKPESVGRSYLNQRWRKFLCNLYDSDYTRLRQPFSEWLRARWDAAFADPDEWRRVETLEILFYRERTPPPGEPHPAPHRVGLHKVTFR